MIDTQLLTEMQYALMETPDNGQTFLSGLWSQAELVAYMNERQNRFLTQVWVGIANVPNDGSNPTGIAQFNLPQDWLVTVGLIWFGVDGTVYELTRADSFEADHGRLGPYPLANGTPKLYFDHDSPMLTITVAPAPAVNGVFQLLYVPQGQELTGQPPGITVSVTDEYAHAVCKYGPLADLFAKAGRAQNLDKAAYCELRYRMAEEMSSIVLNGWA